MNRKIVLAVATSLLAFAASACNTVHGAGQDLESASDTVQKKVS